MTVKEFFKSTAFKCIAVLLGVLIVCGALLTIAYGFLEVTAGERLARAVNQIYGAEVEIYGKDGEKVDTSTRNPVGLTDGTVTVGQADITQAYKITYKENDKDVVNYLVQSCGKGGYAGGSVTLWVALTAEGEGENEAITGINKVIISGNSGQSFIGNITDEFLKSFSEGFDDFDTVEEVLYTEKDGYVVTGTSRSSNAIRNAVNAAIEFVDVSVLGHSRVNKFEGFKYVDLIDVKQTDFTISGTDVTYTIVTQNGDGTGIVNPNAFEITVTVGADKKIKSYEIVTNGSTSGTHDYAEDMTPEIRDGSRFVGKELTYFTDLFGEDMTYPGDRQGTEVSTGATQSNFLCLYAAAFAIANYDACIAQGGNA